MTKLYLYVCRRNIETLYNIYLYHIKYFIYVYETLNSIALKSLEWKHGEVKVYNIM